MSASAHDAESRAAVDDVIASRRDIRRGFTIDPIDDVALERILVAAHQAPSLGLSQPWDFLLLRDVEQRQRIQALAARQRDTFAASLPTGRARLFDGIKVEAILVTSLNIVVTCDTGRGVPTPWGDTRILEWLRSRLPWPFRTSGWRRGPRVSGGLGQLLRPRRAGACAGPAGLSRCGGLPVRGPC